MATVLYETIISLPIQHSAVAIMASSTGSTRMLWGQKVAQPAQPAKTNLQDHARLCKNLACKTCLACARDMSLFLHDSCTMLHNSCKILKKKKCGRNSKLAGNYSCSISCKILHHFLQDMCKIMQDSARIVQEKGHIACKSCMQDSCTILHDLVSSFLLPCNKAASRSGQPALDLYRLHTHL